MFLRIKKNIIELLTTVFDMSSVISNTGQKDKIEECIMAFTVIRQTLHNEEKLSQKSLQQIGILLQALQEAREDCNNTEINTRCLQENIILLIEIIKEEIKPKLNVAFFPYKASMWNSLATIYEAAAKDADCVAKVIVVPFYEIDGKNAVPQYEAELFPKNVPITSYNDYDLEAERPDVIYVHYPYDQYNTITRLDERFFLSNLKKYTDMLVYVPYCSVAYKKYKKGDYSAAFFMPTMQYLDKVILANDELKEGAILNGVPEEKILVLGSPKIDSVTKKIKKDEFEYPKGWKEKLEGKTVYLFNTGCMYFANDPNAIINFTSITLSILMSSNKNALIWRPHPLTLASIKRYTPQYIDWYLGIIEYIKSGKIRGMNKSYILDDLPDYLPAFKVSDILVSENRSLFYEYLATGKKIISFTNFPKNNEFIEGTLLDKKAFYFICHPEEGIYELVYKLCEGYDPCKEFRTGLVNKVFKNLDGNCGRKVYETIKSTCMK